MRIYGAITYLVFIFFCICPPAPCTASARSQDELEAEIRALRAEFEQMKQAYEERIAALEESLEKKETAEQPSEPTHKAAQVGSYAGAMNPDISIVANLQTNLTDNKEDDNRGKVRLKEAEIAFQGYLYPGVRGDLIAALEQEYEDDSSTTEADLEEAYVSFLELPCGLAAEVGRKLLGFGKLNPIHPHHWPFADTPLVLQNFFGEHNWMDDGVLVSALVPNPWDVHIKTSLGYYNGRDPGHAHTHEGEEEHEDEPEVVDWNGRVYLSRTSAGFDLDDRSDVEAGYSFAWDEPRDTELHGFDLTYKCRWPGSYRKAKWQNEFLFSDMDVQDTESWGWYSLLQYTLDKNWEIGGRYDWAEMPSDDEHHEWAMGPFVTYYFTESFYARGQYRYRNMVSDDSENTVFMQLVWGLGPHSHRLTD